MAQKKESKPKILLVKRTDSYVQIRHETLNTREQKVDVEKTKAQADASKSAKTKEVTNSEEIDMTAHDEPIESFDTALQSLGAVAANVLGCGADWAEGIEVVSLALSYTENGTRTATIAFSKKLLKGTAFHPLKTPAFQIEDDKSDASQKRQCQPKHADLVIDVIKEAQRYVLGERGQGTLGFKETGEDDDLEASNVEQLPGMRAVPDDAND